MSYFVKNFFRALLLLSFFVFPLSCEENVEKKSCQVLILGSGVGGLTSAVYFARGGFDTFLIEGQNPGGLIVKSPLVENWPGEKGIRGEALAEKIYDQAYALGCKFYKEKVIEVSFEKRPFTITTEDLVDKGKRRIYLADICIVAMGTEVKVLGLDREKELLGRGISTCAICDGALYKDKMVAVVGSGDAAMVEANYLSKMAKKVYLLARGQNLKGKDQFLKKQLLKNPRVEILFNTEVSKLEGDKKLTALEITRDGTKQELSVDGLFLALGHFPNSELFKGKLKLDKDGYIITSRSQETSIKGVFAVGDITKGDSKQAINAASHASIAFEKAQRTFSPQLKKAASLKEEQVAKIREIKDKKSFNDALASSDGFILIDFYAPWCPPCKMAARAMENSYPELSSKIEIYKVNVDEFSELARDFDIYSLPSFLIIDRNGHAAIRKSGYYEVLKLLEDIQNSDVENLFKEFEKGSLR